MRKLFLITFLVVFFYAISSAGESSSVSEYVHETFGITITLAGDSITDGMIKDDENPPVIQVEPGLCYQDGCFAGLLQSLFENRDGEHLTPVRLEQVGEGGATSRDWSMHPHTNDLQYVLNGFKRLFENIMVSDIVTLYVGTNDALGFFEDGGPIPPEMYEQYIYEFAMQLQLQGVRYVVLVTPPIPRALHGKPAGERMVAYGNAVRRVCRHLPMRAKDCLLDLQKTYPENDWSYKAIHPTHAGHQFIAEKYFQHLNRLVRQIDRRRNGLLARFSRWLRYPQE